jgi:hypothetical protein
MSKFLLNLHVQIYKVLVYSKIQFLFGKEFSSDFGPTPPVLARFAPYAARSTLSPFGLSSLDVFAKRCISFDFAHSDNDTSLSHVTAMWAPPVSYIPFPMPSDLSHIAASPHRLQHPVPPGLQHRDANRGLYSPALIPPFNPPLTPH